VIPLAVLTQPYFRDDVPRYIPYATIGVIFSHEMLHGFDLTGICYDSKGEPREWFTPESRLRLEARLDCVAKQYASAFLKKVKFLGANVEVQVSIENISVMVSFRCNKQNFLLVTILERHNSEDSIQKRIYLGVILYKMKARC
jgi:predicted metalloendopeptidase